MNRIKNAKIRTIEGVLYLEGVFKSDGDNLNNYWSEKLLHTPDTKMYDKLPLLFTTIEEWPKKTNLLCWACTRSIKSRPWFEPQSIDPRGKGPSGVVISGDKLKRNITKVYDYNIGVRGSFCSAHCVMRYILDRTKDLSERINKIAMLRIVYEIFTGKPIIDIVPSPPHYELQQYGGTLSDPEFQKKIDNLNISEESANFAANCKEFINLLED